MWTGEYTAKVHEMRRLILVRHARATHQAGPDHQRWLTNEGLRDAEVLGHMIADHVVGSTVALVSTAKRAEQTWQQCSGALPQVEVHVHEELYNAVQGLRAIVEVIRQAEERFATVIVVAHNPGLEELMLTCPEADTLGRTTLPTSGFVTLDVAANWHEFEPSGARALALRVARSHT
jgi:phosphohistidine phosphatase